MQGKNGNSTDKLGTLLTYEKSLSKNQLQFALRTQKEYREVSIPSRLGEVLVTSKTCPATVVSSALHRQRDQQVKSNTIGQVLLELGFVTKPQLDKVMETHLDLLAPFGEILVDQGICNQEQIQKALHIQLMRRVSAIRRPLSSSFDPVNIMELLVEEEIDEIIKRLEGCDCDQCRANILAIALNGLAPRYRLSWVRWTPIVKNTVRSFGKGSERQLNRLKSIPSFHAKLRPAWREERYLDTSSLGFRIAMFILPRIILNSSTVSVMSSPSGRTSSSRGSMLPRKR
jgi:hypothetical protein